jgi:DNA repair protein RadC
MDKTGKPEKKNIHAGHRQRMKTRFRQNGERAFDDCQLLELLLFYSIPQRDTNVIAHELMNQFHSLSGVLDATVEDLMTVRGVSEHTALLIHLLPQFARRYRQARTRMDQRVTSTLEAGALLEPYFYGARNEMVYMLSVDARGRVLGIDLLGEGSANFCALDIRLVTETALRRRAQGVVLSHCHVTGSCTPSQDDRTTTEYCMKVLNGVDVALLDHLVFADGDYTSMLQNGMLRPHYTSAQKEF